MSFAGFVFMLECAALRRVGEAEATTLGMSDSDEAKTRLAQLRSIGTGHG